MESQVSRLKRYPDYAALNRHIGTTRQQLQRLEQALGAAGESISSIKETVTSVGGTVGATVHGMFQDETLKNLYAGYAYQYEQIGASRSLTAIAEAAGETAHISAFRQSVQEDEQAAAGRGRSDRAGDPPLRRAHHQRRHGRSLAKQLA